MYLCGAIESKYMPIFMQISKIILESWHQFTLQPAVCSHLLLDTPHLLQYHHSFNLFARKKNSSSLKKTICFLVCSDILFLFLDRFYILSGFLCPIFHHNYAGGKSIYSLNWSVRNFEPNLVSFPNILNSWFLSIISNTRLFTVLNFYTLFHNKGSWSRFPDPRSVSIISFYKF